MKKIISMVLCVTMVLGLSGFTFAKTNYDIDSVITDTANYLCKTINNPKVGSIGGEWTILGLARSGMDISEEYYQNYYKNVEDYIKLREGKLHDKKYTEYSRVIIALTSIGKNPADVAGYNILTPLGDYEKTIFQGINGAIWALIALDCGNYEIPSNIFGKVQATREMYINHILEKQLSNGGWALSGEIADPDVTGMALQALYKYQDNKNVKLAIDNALEAMSQIQDDKGGFSSFETANSESCVQILVALCELGISIEDRRFVKNGYTIIDSLMNYYTCGNGFIHDSHSNSSNLMAAEQALYGLVAVKRAKTGMSSLYRMSDAILIDVNGENIVGLKNKNADVHLACVINPGKTFKDIVGHKNKNSIEELARRGIINGKTENSFQPNSTMKRAEFATIIVRGLGLPVKSKVLFKDVTENDWFYNYVGTAYAYGIIKGVSENEFNPNGTITREEASVMVSRAAKLCGMETEMDMVAIREVLCQFFDYVKVSDWAQGALAFCYKTKILDNSGMDIKSNEAVTRGEIADIIYRLLENAKLL